MSALSDGRGLGHSGFPYKLETGHKLDQKEKKGPSVEQ